jgi:chromosome segregation protein
MLIQEIIIENFMSYEYARIPFKQGVNVICGPNGAGKSSILLAISVVLGQSYTERAKKLSDLIRWGKDQARITIVLDNSLHRNRRPVPKFNKDQIFLTRILRRDGQYWFELNGKAVTKAEVERLLTKLGVDTDNMLIIMHQNMVEQFSALSPQEKLRIIEEAVGLESYRKNVVEAQKKLSRILSQEESVNQLLENAEQTLNYWREQHERYQQKKQLLLKQNFLERELAWAEVSKKESTLREIESQIKKEEKNQAQILDEIKILNEGVENLQQQAKKAIEAWQSLHVIQIQLERERAKVESDINFANQTIEEIQNWTQTSQKYLQECLTKIEKLPSMPQLVEIREAYKNFESIWAQQLTLKNHALKKILTNANNQLEGLNLKISETQKQIQQQSLEIQNLQNQIVDNKIRLALLQYRKELTEKTLKKLQAEFEKARFELEENIKKAEQKGSRIVSMKEINEILEEIRITDGHLAALSDVSEDIERMYEAYSKLYLELKEKARLVTENREKTLEEVKTRMQAWRTVIQNLLERANLQYQAILSQVQAIGEVKLINGEDIETAGIEILVGFKGAKAVPLNAYTQSGGERSTAIMSFLLALQQHVRSPFRAVDEFDIHMDPRNRELIARLLITSVKTTDNQYVIITPSQITFADQDIHMITVQNIEGASVIKGVSK